MKKLTLIIAAAIALGAAGCGTAASSSSTSPQPMPVSAPAASSSISAQALVQLMRTTEPQVVTAFCTDYHAAISMSVNMTAFEQSFAYGYDQTAAGTNAPSAQSVFNVLVGGC